MNQDLEKLQLSLGGYFTEQWPVKRRSIIGVLACVDLTKCHGMAISGYPMSTYTGLNVVRKGDGLEAIGYFIKESETGH